MSFVIVVVGLAWIKVEKRKTQDNVLPFDQDNLRNDRKYNADIITVGKSIFIIGFLLLTFIVYYLPRMLGATGSFVKLLTYLSYELLTPLVTLLLYPLVSYSRNKTLRRHVYELYHVCH